MFNVQLQIKSLAAFLIVILLVVACQKDIYDYTMAELMTDSLLSERLKVELTDEEYEIYTEEEIKISRTVLLYGTFAKSLEDAKKIWMAETLDELIKRVRETRTRIPEQRERAFKLTMREISNSGELSRLLDSALTREEAQALADWISPYDIRFDTSMYDDRTIADVLGHGPEGKK